MEVRRAIAPSVQESDDRVPTGIPSLDKIIEGGLRRGDCIIVAGQPGTGKTTLGLQFLYHGATRCGENGVYASVIESSEKLKRNGLRFGWDLNRLENEGNPSHHGKIPGSRELYNTNDKRGPMGQTTAWNQLRRVPRRRPSNPGCKLRQLKSPPKSLHSQNERHRAPARRIRLLHNKRRVLSSADSNSPRQNTINRR